MAYRRTKKVEERLARTREDIVTAALGLVAEGGYAAASMPAIAARAEVSTGLLYRYFPSKADLFEEVFRRASQREIDACARRAAAPGTARERLAGVVETFARRALKGPRLASGSPSSTRAGSSRSTRRSRPSACAIASPIAKSLRG